LTSVIYPTTSGAPFIAYSREKSWTNGLCWYLWVISWLRSHGVKASIVFTVDNGEEFGGKSWMKVRELRKLISGFGCRLIQNHKGHCEENAHLERSHRTDDDEFYIPRALEIKSEAALLNEAMGYIYYYNNVREHSSLNYQTPFSFLRAQMPEINDRIRLVIPIMLDKVAVELGPWSGYHVLAQHLGYGVPPILVPPRMRESLPFPLVVCCPLPDCFDSIAWQTRLVSDCQASCVANSYCTLASRFPQ